MNRRAFLSSLAAFTATMALDPEKLLWVPGKKLISITKPSASLVVSGSEFSDGDIVTFGNSTKMYRILLTVENSLRLEEVKDFGFYGGVSWPVSEREFRRGYPDAGQEE